MVEKPDLRPKPGSIVEIIDREGTFRRPRLLQRPFAHRVARVDAESRRSRSTKAFFARKIATAVELRREVLKLDAVTNAYRLIHSEGDGFRDSSSIASRIRSVVEYFSAGMFSSAT